MEAGWVQGAEGFRNWQRQQLEDTLGYLDWPLLARLYQACRDDDAEAFARWSQFLLANRETAELRLEERQRGMALARLLDGWQLCQAPEWRASLGLSQLGGMAWLGVHWDIPLRDLALGHGFAWLEGAVMAGVKLVPFGQQAAQSLLRDLCEALPEVLQRALQLPDEQLGGGLPLLAIASARHETQYTRLFRS
ncbi:Urease accessory protein UreF [compost metagenome]